MPLSTKQFIEANIAYNKMRQNVGKEMEKYGPTPGATPTAVDLQLIADKQFVAALDKISFPTDVKADIAKLKILTQDYDRLITQEREYLVTKTDIPTQLSLAITTNSADHSATYVAIKKELKLPDSSCQFISP